MPLFKSVITGCCWRQPMTSVHHWSLETWSCVVYNTKLYAEVLHFQTHLQGSQNVQRDSFLLFNFLFLEHLISRGSNNYKVKVLTLNFDSSWGYSHLSLLYSGKVWLKQSTIPTQLIKCQCKHPHITAKGQYFNIRVEVLFGACCSWASSQNSRHIHCLNSFWLHWWCFPRHSSSLGQNLCLSRQLCHTDWCNKAPMQTGARKANWEGHILETRSL